MNDHAGRRRFLNWFHGPSIGALLVSIAYPVMRFLGPPRMPESTTRQVKAGTVNDPSSVVRQVQEGSLGMMQMTGAHPMPAFPYLTKEEVASAYFYPVGYPPKP